MTESSGLQRLAVYGTLAPGRVNHHHLADLAGHWVSGQVRGHLVEGGWGSALGYPAITLDPDGPIVEVQVLESDELSAHWARLDEFEGEAYRRTVTSVRTKDGPVDAYIYELVG